MKKLKFIGVFKINCNLLPNFVQNIFCNTSTLLEQPLLLYITVTVVWSECDIFVCSVCTGNWCIFSMLCVLVLTLPGCMFSQLIVTWLSRSVALCMCKNPSACSSSCIIIPCDKHPLRCRFSCWRCE